MEKTKKKINLNPESEVGKKLIKEWDQLIDKAYVNYPRLKNKLEDAYKSGVIPSSFFMRDQQVIDFLSKAAKKWRRK